MTKENSPQTVWKEEALTPLAIRAFMGLGMTQADAAEVVKVLVQADLFGLSTHGLSRIES
jgi:LDH2 family malate/lactate/ureidoglycolate dehydrogenase